jgi:hypothetical protein
MPRIFLYLIVIATLVIGAPYAALLIDRAMGRWEATGIEHDGSVTHMSFGADLPRPEWIFMPPGANIVQASHVRNERQQRDVGMLELTTHQPLPEIKKFYEERLSRAEFSVVDQGTGTMDARTAKFLGVAGILVAVRVKSGDRIDITIRAPEGLFRTTLVQLRWWKIPPEPDPPSLQR